MELKTKTLVFILASFILGGVAGGFIGKTYFSSPSSSRRPPRSEILKQFASRLKLNPAQAAQVDSILESFRQKFDDVQKRYWQAVHLKRDTLRLSIRKLLTEEQIELYDDYIKEMSEREGRRRGEKEEGRGQEGPQR